MNENQLYEWYLIVRNTLKMLQARGFNINDDNNFDLLDETISDRERFEVFSERYEKESLESLKDDISKIYTKGKKYKLYLSFVTDSGQSTGINIINNIKATIEKEKANHGIIIYDVKLSPDSGKEINKSEELLSAFQKDELIQCPIDHKDVPKHTLLSSAEQENLLKEFKLKSFKDIPLILETDPIVKFYGWRAGSVVKIERDDFYLEILTPKTLQYRYIVPAQKK